MRSLICDPPETRPMANNTPPLTDFHRKFVALLDEVRSERGQMHVDVATLLGRHPTRISKWKSGKGEPTPSDLAAMVEAFGVTFDYLCDPAVREKTGACPYNPLLKLNTAAGLTEKQRMILDLARRIGEDVAIDRMLNVPGQVTYHAKPE